MIIIDEGALPKLSEGPPPSYDGTGPSHHRPTHPNEMVSSGPAGAPSTQDNKSKGKARNWFGLSRRSKEVKATVNNKIRDAVEQQTTSASVVLLQNCVELCSAHNLDFSCILQDLSIEGHPPIYWAIIKWPSSEEYELLNAILSYSVPLKARTVSQIRLACLRVGDQALFYNLWRSPELATWSYRDEMLLGISIPPDLIQVQELPDDKGSFVAQFEILQFVKRMKVSGVISLEFIARDRVWWLRFHVLSERQDISRGRRLGAWAVSLAILEHSTPTWIDSQVIIREQCPHKKLPSKTYRLSPYISYIEPVPEVSFDLKTNDEQLRPLPANRKRRSNHDALTVLFEDVHMGSGLQYSDSSFYDPDGTLYVSLQGNLRKPQEEVRM